MAEEQLDRIELLLGQAVAWLQILAGPTVRSWLEPMLTTTEERKVYQASTGGAMQEVGQAAGVTHQTVSNYWNRWKAASPAIVEKTQVKGRYQRLYDLSEINMPLEADSA